MIDGELSKRDGTPDLKPSAYNAAQKDVTRVCVEHRANSGMPPPNKKSFVVDLDNLGVTATPDPLLGLPFSFCAQRHTVLRCVNRDALVRLVEAARAAQRTALPAAVADMNAYVRQRLAAGDLEWTAFVSSAEGAAWRFATP